MGQVRNKKNSVGIITSDDEQSISYCDHCEEFGFKQVLGPKILLKGEPIPRDHDQWLQCPACHTVIPIYEAKQESRLTDFVETSSNPFDSGYIITGIGNKKPKNRYQRERQKLLEKIDKEKDEDIKQALRRGAVVEIIED